MSNLAVIFAIYIYHIYQFDRPIYHNSNVTNIYDEYVELLGNLWRTNQQFDLYDAQIDSLWQFELDIFDICHKF